MTQSTPISPHNGASSGNGQQFPNLFNLGPDRTLSLINGRRVVGSGNGLGGSTVGGSAVDTNMIPVGLLDHVDVVLGGGSVVYGSDAIAGVVNYVLKDHFVGLEVDGQAGLSERGDYPNDSARVTAGTDFLGGKGNIALDVEWSKADPLLLTQRTNLPQAGYTAADSDAAWFDNLRLWPDQTATFWEFSRNGVLFVNPPGTFDRHGISGRVRRRLPRHQYRSTLWSARRHPAAIPCGRFRPQELQCRKQPAERHDAAEHSVLQRRRWLSLHRTRIAPVGRRTPRRERAGACRSALRHEASTELFYGRTEGIDPNAEYGNNSNTALNNPQSGAGMIIVKASNPYLPASAKNTIVNYLNTTFGGGLGFGWEFGAPIPAFAVGLSKAWSNLLPSYADTVGTDTYRGLLAL